MWNKKGQLFNPADFLSETIKSHAAIPYCQHLEGDSFRIFFSSRDASGQSYPYYVDAHVSEGQISLIGNVSGPLLQLGEKGTFDDCGIMPSSLVRHNGKLYLFYIGWNPQVTVSYRLAIGLAVSDDMGKTFRRVGKGPVCDRSFEEPFFNTAPYVIYENGIWRMWYISCTGWQTVHDYPEPSYHVKYAESNDGITWQRNGIVCIDYDERATAIGRPCVLKKGNGYEMFFSYRQVEGYRTDKGKGYQIGRAFSFDGISWEKDYDHVGIGLSESGWDSKMMEYCHVFNHNGIDYMLYNGNGFGSEGFGYAVR